MDPIHLMHLVPPFLLLNLVLGLFVHLKLHQMHHFDILHLQLYLEIESFLLYLE